MNALTSARRSPIEWAVLTPEFPPVPGGVSDYSAIIAQALAAAGDSVSVWFPGRATLERPGNPRLAPLPAGFGVVGIRRVAMGLADLPPETRVLLQYAPHAFGYKGLNLPFVGALSKTGRNALDVVFHEVAYPGGRGSSARHRVLSVVQFTMARWLAERADRVFVSTEAWRPLLEKSIRRSTAIAWLPVPSNLPTCVSHHDTAAERKRILGGDATVLLGHFSTYAPGIVDYLRQCVPRLLRADLRRKCVLMGRGAHALRQSLSSAHPALAAQLVSFEDIAAAELARVVSACDIMMQPYPDGVSGRRTTVMAAIALGIPTVTTQGRLSETVWAASGGVALSSAGSIQDFAVVVERVLGDPVLYNALGPAGRKLYQSVFDVSNTVRLLRRL